MAYGGGPASGRQATEEAQRRARGHAEQLAAARADPTGRHRPAHEVRLRHVALAAAPMAVLVLYVAARGDPGGWMVLIPPILFFVGLFVVLGWVLRAR